MGDCKRCQMIWMADPGYYCYLGTLVMEMEKEESPRKRKRLRGQMDWALQRLQEMSDLKKEIHSSQSLPNLLLAACESTLEELDLVYGEHAEKAREILHAAIAKVTGEDK